MVRPFIATAIAAFLVVTLANAQSNDGTADDVVQTSSGPVKVEHLAALSYPWGMTFLPDGRMLVTEKPGRLRIYSSGSLSEPIRGVPTVVYKDQGGLLDVELDPDFARNGLVYLYFVEAAKKQSNVGSDTRDPRVGPGQDLKDVTLKGGAVARGRLDGNQLRNVKVIWRQEPKMIGRNHFGGRLVFSPDDKLFITSGDRQRFDPAQDFSGNLGKVVRINPDGTIPEDNPFVNKAGVHTDIWSAGHRNPLGAAINPASKQLWIHEMGPWNGDEINIPEAGKNYGWPVVSNGDNYDGTPIPDHASRTDFAAPEYYWHPAVSPSGMIFYTGTRFADWQGNVLLGALSAESLLRLTLEGDVVKKEERIPMRKRVRDVIQAPDEAVLIITDYKEGELLRLTPASDQVQTGAR
jgi:glucose/arabinose dehydrogenase